MDAVALPTFWLESVKRKVTGVVPTGNLVVASTSVKTPSGPSGAWGGRATTDNGSTSS